MTAPMPKGGVLARLSAQLCQSPEFLQWGRYKSSDEAAKAIREACGVSSRAQLDHNRQAAEIFHRKFRRPFVERHK